MSGLYRGGEYGRKEGGRGKTVKVKSDPRTDGTHYRTFTQRLGDVKEIRTL